jgi:regulator of RNase E activity RraA
VAVEAGDIVIGDRDSVVVIPQRQAEHTRDATAQARALEAKLETARTVANVHPSWAEEALAGCEITIVR